MDPSWINQVEVSHLHAAVDAIYFLLCFFESQVVTQHDDSFLFVLYWALVDKSLSTSLAQRQCVRQHSVTMAGERDKLASFLLLLFFFIHTDLSSPFSRVAFSCLFATTGQYGDMIEECSGLLSSALAM